MKETKQKNKKKRETSASIFTDVSALAHEETYQFRADYVSDGIEDVTDSSYVSNDVSARSWVILFALRL